MTVGDVIGGAIVGIGNMGGGGKKVLLLPPVLDGVELAPEPDGRGDGTAEVEVDADDGTINWKGDVNATVAVAVDWLE